MPDPLITKEQLENRLSAVVVRRIYDDDMDGATDVDVIDALIRDASSKVRGKLGPVYDQTRIDENTNDEITRVTLDVAVAYAAQRHPEVVRYDWIPLMNQADKDLKDIRTAVANLGTDGGPGPAANTGGELFADDGGDEPTKFFSGCGGTGIF